MTDITVVNDKMNRMWEVEDWKVDTGESFSDHRYITFTGGKQIKEERLQRNLRKADWAVFREALRENRWPEVDPSDLDDLAKVFQDKVVEALDKASQ